MLALLPLLAALQAAPIALPPRAVAPTPRQLHGAGEPRRLLLVDLDDLGFDLLRATPTPTLDWLEASGRFFTNFTTSPVCAPTRAMVHAGVFPSHPDLLMGANPTFLGSFSMPTAPLEPLGSMVASAGFTTAKVGKWHLAPEIDPTHPQRCGWQSYAGVLSNVGSGSPLKTYFNYNKWVDGVGERVSGTYLTTDETDDAIAFVMADVDFVSLSYHAPHAPVHLPPPALHSVTPLASDFDRTRAMLAACDTELNRVLSAAIARSYHVIVFSDNGTSSAIGGGKGTLFDSGVVNPFWAIGPTFVPGVDDTRFTAADIYDTVGAFFGIDVTGRSRGPQSSSVLPSLMGRRDFRRWTYSERFQGLGQDPRTSQLSWRRAVRGARYKLHRRHPAQTEELYDLFADPSEQFDLLQQPGLSPAAQRAYDHFQEILRRL